VVAREVKIAVDPVAAVVTVDAVDPVANGAARVAIAVAADLAVLEGVIAAAIVPPTWIWKS